MPKAIALAEFPVPTGLLALLISGRLSLANISPLALTLSNTYGELLNSVPLLVAASIQCPSVALLDEANTAD